MPSLLQFLQNGSVQLIAEPEADRQRASSFTRWFDETYFVTARGQLLRDVGQLPVDVAGVLEEARSVEERREAAATGKEERRGGEGKERIVRRVIFSACLPRGRGKRPDCRSNIYSTTDGADVCPSST